MQKNQTDNLYKTLSKTIVIAAVAVVVLWLLYKVASVLLVFLLAIIVALIINAPVSWIEKKGIKRIWACALVFGGILIVLGLLGWLVFPKIYQQFQALVLNLPNYIQSLKINFSSWVSDYPAISKEIKNEGEGVSQWLPSLQELLTRITNFSFSLVGLIFLFILFVCIILYAVSNPRPLLEIYYSFFAVEKREKAQQALTHTSKMLIGWIRANLIGGGIEAVCTTAFLSIMNVPGAWVWGALALFAELIPNLGFYIMAVPPILVAFAVSPVTAFWVLIFFLVLSEIMANAVMPKLIASNMNLHPVSTLFMLLVMGTAFGLIGALMTIPITAIIKAYYLQFFKNEEKDSDLNKRIDNVVYYQAR